MDAKEKQWIKDNIYEPPSHGYPVALVWKGEDGKLFVGDMHGFIMPDEIIHKIRRTGITEEDYASAVLDEKIRSLPLGMALTPRKRTEQELRRDTFRKNRRELYRGIIERGDKEECAYCHSKEKLAVDHILALSKGGSDDIDNLQILCQSCNSRKGVKTYA